MDETANQGDKAKPGAAAQPAPRVSLFGRRRKNGNGNGNGAASRRPPSRRAASAAPAFPVFPAR